MIFYMNSFVFSSCLVSTCLFLFGFDPLQMSICFFRLVVFLFVANRFIVYWSNSSMMSIQSNRNIIRDRIIDRANDISLRL